MGLVEHAASAAAYVGNGVPFPIVTCATNYGEHIHWDLWGPVSVQSLSDNHYITAHMDDATHETVLYLQRRRVKPTLHIRATKCTSGHKLGTISK